MRQDAMTSEKVVLNRTPRRAPSRTLLFTLTLLLVVVGGCRLMPERIDQPTALISPYPGAKLWAVMPLRNESGTSVVDSAAMADRLAAEIERVEGIGVLPVNRVLAELDRAEFDSVNSVGEAMQLMHRLEVDGLIVGTISAWQPYEPPEIGASIQLYSRRSPDADPIDTRALSGAPTDEQVGLTNRYEQPVASVGGHFDAGNGTVLQRLKDYAEGRTPPQSAAGWRRYLLSMDLYARFVSHELTRRLLDAERDRLWRNADEPDAGRRDSAAAQQTEP